MISAANRLTLAVRNTSTRSRLGGAIRWSISLFSVLVLLARDDLLAFGALHELHEGLDRRLDLGRVRVGGHVAGLGQLPRTGAEVGERRLDAVDADELDAGVL